MSIIQWICVRSFKKPTRTDGAAMWADKYKIPYMAKEQFVDGMRMVTVERAKCNGHHFYYFHGGGYIVEANSMHRDTVKTLVDLGYRVTYVDYPMAPEHTASYTNDHIRKGYAKITSEYKEDVFHIIGDSAGGGLALSFLMQLRDQTDLPMPQKSVLISPWLDLSMENPDLQDHRKGDWVLPYDGLVYAGKLYAGELGVKDPYVSPMYGDMNGLGELLLFYSSKEMFVADCEKLVSLMRKAKGTSIQAVRGKGGFHDFVTFVHLKASKEAYQRIKQFIAD